MRDSSWGDAGGPVGSHSIGGGASRHMEEEQVQSEDLQLPPAELGHAYRWTVHNLTSL